MSSDEPGSATRRRQAGRATAAVGAVGIQSASSLVLQVLAAHALGPAGYGVFTIILGILITMSALQAGLRDSSIVLEHHDSSLHGPVLVAQYLALVATALITFAIALSFDLTDTVGAVLFATMVGLWVLEEAGRRFLIARMRFWALVANDLVYFAGAVGTVALIHALTDQLTLNSFLLSMAVGSALSFAVATVQLPRGVFRVGSWSRPGLGTVLTFAGWRSAHGLVRPLSTTMVRVAVAGFTSTAGLGRVEAARLLVSPALVVANGLNSFLLPHFVRRLPKSRRAVTRLLTLPTVFTTSTSAAVGVVAVVYAAPLQRLLAGEHYPVDRVATLGWSLFVVAFAAGLPAGALVLAHKLSRQVFINRVIDAAVGLASAVALVAVTDASSAPYGLTLGAVIGGLLMWRRAYRAPTLTHRPRTAAPAPDTAMAAGMS